MNNEMIFIVAAIIVAVYLGRGYIFPAYIKKRNQLIEVIGDKIFTEVKKREKKTIK